MPTLTSEFFYAPGYKTQCISLNAQAADVPQGTIIAVKATADGTFDIIGAGSGDYDKPYGVLLKAAPINADPQTVDVIVIGELFYEFVNGVYKAANSDVNLTAGQVVALRDIGILLK